MAKYNSRVFPLRALPETSAPGHLEGGYDCAIPNPNLLIKSFACKIKYLLKNIVLLYSPGSYVNTLDAGP